MVLLTRDRTNPEVEGDVAIWGGVECTVNRVGDRYFDQLERNGHAARLDDLRRFAELGISTLRFPLLWERIAPDGLESAQWDWADERMELLRELGIRPIVGLLHHGSGPRSTDLLDPDLPQKLAAYARAVAERYPWVDAYTPVNEPLTTARFSALYGVWYPHARSDRSFARALLNECRATSLAIRAIRDVNPRALLVQTEDLGKTHSTAKLRYQARFENQRRWLTFDLLNGDVSEEHPLWKYMRYNLQEAQGLDWMRDNPSPPDIIGFNYYVTSERYLDERIERYAGVAVGGNHRHRYVDIEAVRVLAEGLDGPQRLLREAWDRFRTPMAITEAHLGCARPEQMRWFREIYDAACTLRREGVDIRAVTAWALLGTYDWHCLVTRDEGLYEPGVFDVRGGEPRPTALAQMISGIIGGTGYDHPILAVPGWWRRSDRLLYEPTQSHRARKAARRRRRSEATGNGRSGCVRTDTLHDDAAHGLDDPSLGLPRNNGHVRADGEASANGGAHANGSTNADADEHTDGASRSNGASHTNGASRTNDASRADAASHNNGAPHASGDAHVSRYDSLVASVAPLLVTGATGTLGRAFARVCALRGIPYRLVSRAEMDIADRASVERMLSSVRPWAVVNTAGYVRVDEAERDAERCHRENAQGPAVLAGVCAAHGLPLVTFSSDLVFDGTAGEPYVESCGTSPLNVYGRSKERGELHVLSSHPKALVVRTSAFFGPWDEYNFVTLTLRSLASGQTVVAADDMVVSPTYVPDLVDETLNLLVDGESGIWHLANDGAVTWADLARRVAIAAGHDPELILGRPTGELGLVAARPLYSPLASERGVLLSPLDDALARYFDDRARPTPAASSARVVRLEA